jgi:hypothetical protein
MGDDVHALRRDVGRFQLPFDSCAFGIDVCCKEAGELIRRLEDELEKAMSPRKDQTSEAVKTDRDSGQERRCHAQQTGFRGEAVDDVGALTAEDTPELPQALEVLQGRDVSGNRHLNETHPRGAENITVSARRTDPDEVVFI